MFGETMNDKNKETENEASRSDTEQPSYSDLFYEAELDLGILLDNLEQDGRADEASTVNNLLDTLGVVQSDLGLLANEPPFGMEA